MRRQKNLTKAMQRLDFEEGARAINSVEWLERY
jgi:hypothetical protein